MSYNGYGFQYKIVTIVVITFCNAFMPRRNAVLELFYYPYCKKNKNIKDIITSVKSMLRSEVIVNGIHLDIPTVSDALWVNSF